MSMTHAIPSPATFASKAHKPVAQSQAQAPDSAEVNMSTAPEPPSMKISNYGPAARIRNAEFGRQLAVDSETLESRRVAVVEAVEAMVERVLDVPPVIFAPVRVDCREPQLDGITSALDISERKLVALAELETLSEAISLQVLTSLSPDARALLNDPFKHINMASEGALRWTEGQIRDIQKRLRYSGGQTSSGAGASRGSTTSKPKSKSKRGNDRALYGFVGEARAAEKARLAGLRKNKSHPTPVAKTDKKDKSSNRGKNNGKGSKQEPATK